MRSLSQSSVARHLGLNRTTYVRKERGQIPITTEEWLSLAAFMGVEPGYFFSGIEEEAKEDAPSASYLLALYRSLRAAEQRDLVILITIAFKGIRRKKVQERIACLREAHGV